MTHLQAVHVNGQRIAKSGGSAAMTRPGTGRRWRRGAGAFAAAVLLTACSSGGGDSDDGNGGVMGSDGTVDFPVTWTYDGVEWSITDAEVEADENDKLNVVADVRITNLLPTNVDSISEGQVTAPHSVWLNVSLMTGDNVTVARGDSFEIPSIGEGESTEGTWTFPVEEEPDLADLTLVMDHEDRTPAVVPLDGETFDLPEPIPAEIEADELVTTAMSCGGHWDVHELSEFEAEIGRVDQLGVRARPDHSLLSVSFKFRQTGDRLRCNFGYAIGDGLAYLEIDGDEAHPARGWPVESYQSNDSGTETLLFEVPRDAEEVVFVIAGHEDDGETPEVFRFPVTYDALPACCEE